MGFNLHGSLGLNLAAIARFQGIGKVEYHSFPFDWQETGDLYDFSPSGFDGGDLRALMFGVDARFNLIPAPSPIRPYLFAGPGYANLTTSDLTFPPDPPPNTQVPDELDESESYLNRGVGLIIHAGPTIGSFIEARYVNVFTDGDDIGFVPLTAGISF